MPTFFGHDPFKFCCKQNNVADVISVDELLAEAVRLYPVLYDKASKDFKDRNKKDLLWQDVAQKTGFSSGN